jgi:succinate-semialdehyde dehydrogenase/glutarate-semialdehyde dehydrogenase
MAYETVNPATGECLRRFEEHSDADVTAALNAAHSAHCTWRLESFEGRARLVRRVADLMRERIEPLSALITLEMGKLPAESRGETALSADILSYYAENAERFLAAREIPQKYGTATLVYDPVGIVFAIEPWNFPYYQLARVVGPNLMTGNTVITKHASGVPQCAEAFAKLFEDAGAPHGLYTNLRLSSDQAGVVVADPRVRGVALTGSNRAGEAIAAAAGKAIKPSTLELGGSDPFVVLEDANLPMAIKWGVWSRLLNCGQGCVDAKRFIVVEPLYDAFLQGLKQAVETRVVGDPSDEKTETGPLSSEAAKQRLLEQIARAVGSGAMLVAGGTSIDRPGSYIRPGILTGLAPDNPAYHEEFFGPIFLVFKARDEAEALALANDTEFGLGATIFSEDVKRAKRLARSIDAGMVFINHGAWTAPELPFGGVKSSGFGRELGELGIHEFVNKKLIRAQDATSSAL